MAKADLRDGFSAHWSQSGLHSCMAFVLCDAIGWELRQGAARRFAPTPFRPSPLFVYYNARKRKGQENLNIAVRPSDAIQAVCEHGVCPEEDWPYDLKRYRDRPPPEAYSAARPFAGFQFEELAREREVLKEVLAAGAPFFFCLRLFESNCWDFEYGATASSGRLETPVGEAIPVRNHALLAVGFDDAQSSFLIRNPAGDHWGEEGYGMLPYDYLCGPGMAYACWRVRRFLPDNGGP